jgi:DNA-binding transcriptional LysR family regulator
MISPRVLLYIDEISRQGSIRKAAARLNVAASSVNRQLIALENELGTKLFERLSDRMRPTAAGEMLVAYARETLKQQRLTLSRVTELKDPRFASASIATVGGLANDMLSVALTDYRRERPFARFSVSVIAAEDISREVAAGDIDVGFGFDLPDNRNLAVAAALDSECGAVMLPEHPLASRRRLRLGDLRGTSMILPQRGVTLREQFDDCCARVGLALNPILESNSFELLKHFVMLGQGIAILNRIDVLHSVMSGAVRFIPVAELGEFTQRLKVVHRARGTLAPLPSHLVERLRQRLASPDNS